MARTISWFPRLPALARSVSESARSHYASKDLERLFGVQRRSSQMLMNLLPTVRIGKSLLVEREALASFVARLAAAEDPALELSAIRAAGRPPVVRRRLRELIQRDVDANVTVLPANMSLEPGALAVRFDTVEELAASLWRLAALLEQDLEGFARSYEPVRKTDSAEDKNERADAAFIRDWLANQ